MKHPEVLVSYRCIGFLDEIYAMLVVRLHHTEPFQQDQLWRHAADFKTNTGKQLGVKLTRRAPGVGELEVYFDPAVAMEGQIIFSKYVHEHLLQHARDVERLRHYVCPQCGTPVGNREVAMKRLNGWLQGRPPQPEAGSGFKVRKGKEEPPSIICVGCEQRVPLWDAMEQCFASPEIQHRGSAPCAIRRPDSRASERDHVTLGRQDGPELEALSDEFRQRFSPARFTMGQHHFGLRGGEMTKPLQQGALAGVGAEAVKRVDARLHRHLFAEDFHRLVPVHEPAAQRAFALVAYDHHGRVRLPKPVLEVMQNAPGIAHARAGHDEARTRSVVELHRILRGGGGLEIAMAAGDVTNAL